MAVLSARTGNGAVMKVMLALVVAVASVPVLYGVVAGDRRCTITLDICHPIQSVSSSAAPPLAPPPTRASIAGSPFQPSERLAGFAPAHTSRPADAPDPPPPRRAA